MNKTNNSPNNMKKEKRNLRKKLYAALSMLLVCTTLLTTATYAWLSLSVAPAVEKVKTTITGNGSLEIALATTDVIKNLDLIDDFESLTGFDADGNYDSKANANWGNLVDLSDDKYGLSLLKLYPALLNIVGGKVGDNPLKIANFGADGRVTFLNADTTSAMYDTNTGAFLLNDSTDYGVRALGVSTSTGLWDALESALRNTQKDASDVMQKGIFKVKIAVGDVTVPMNALLERLRANQSIDTLVKTADITKIVDLVLGTDPVEATETTEAVEGTDGLIDKLDTAVRNLILACSGYSDKYVSISADEMLEKVESDVSTVQLIENYVIYGTDLANLCDLYVTAVNYAETLKGVCAQIVAANPTGTLTDRELAQIAEPLFGNSFEHYYTAVINRTAGIKQTVTEEIDGETVTTTVSKMVVTHDNETIYASTADELTTTIESLKSVSKGEYTVASCTATNKGKYIKVKDTDNLMAVLAQITGDMALNGQSYEMNTEYLLKPLLVEIPCASEKCAIDQLSSVEKEFAYQESLYTLQTMWNELDIHRNALAAAIDGEMTALTEIVRSAKYFEDNNKTYDKFEQIKANNPDSTYQHSVVKKANYTAPRTASHETLKAHISTMQSALDFYYDFTVQAALTYASKDTTPVDAYINLTKLLATEEGVRTIPLADILSAVGTNFITEYSPAISSYNQAKTAVANAQQLFDDYYTMVNEQTKAAQANGTTPPPHPTWQEDLALRSAFTDITPFSEYITATEPMEGTYFDVNFRGGIVYDLINLGLGRVPYANYYYSEKYGHQFSASYDANRNSGVDYFNSFTRDPALYRAWLEMTDQESPEGAQKFNDILIPIVTVYDEYNQRPSYDVPLYETAWSAGSLAQYHQSKQVYDINELWAMGSLPDETYDQYDVNSIRETYTALKNTYLPKANNFIRATVENYLMETGLVNDDGITITDAQGNVAMTTSVKTILKGIIDTVFADSTKPMADRVEAELKTAIGNVAYAEFRMYSDELTYAMSDDHNIWVYIKEAMAQYDAVLTKMADLDHYLKAAEAKFPQEIVWEDISPLVMLVTGESTWGRYSDDSEFDSEYTFYLSEDSVFVDLVSLYSDKFEYETYHRGGNWRYTPYNLSAPLPELELGLSKLTRYWDQESHYNEVTETWEYETIYDLFYLNKEVELENGRVVLMTNQSVYVGTHRNFFIRANQFSFLPDNGITPLYNLATNNSKSVQTDRSIMFRNLVKEMKLAKASAEDSKYMINLNTLTEYIGKTMYKGDYEYVDEDFKLMTLNDLGQSMVATKLPETLPETFTYDEVEMLITTLDGVTNAMNSYKASLRTAFMLWASSANGTKAAYKAVAANYTGTLDDMMVDAKLSAGNVYYDAYNYVQQILDKTQQSRELLTTILAGKPETVTENDTVQAATLKQALLPLAGQLYWGVYGSTFNPFDRVALYSDDSVMGYIYALYIPSGSEYYSVQLDNSYYNIRFRAPATNLMQQAINTAVEGGITFDANVSANTYANAILSDSYAFAIDILLRTNAIDSNVLLQTEEMQRIYNEEFGDVETMGKGSYLKYTLTNESQRQQMSQINDCVRVVFTDTNTGEILAVAKPDALEVPELSYEEIYGDNPKEESKNEEIEYVGYLHLCDYTITDSGILYVGDKLDSAAIMPLERNKTTPVTVYVYLDGNDMTNAVASATEHINFDMNLQFASDAELVPANSNLGGKDYDLPSDPVNPTPTPDAPSQPTNPTPTPDAPSQPTNPTPTPTPDVTVEATGSCGDNLTWKLEDDYTLIISGTGDMTEFEYSSSVPWGASAEQIKEIIIEDGVTSIGNYAFYYCSQVPTIEIPDSVISIGDYAFYRCESLTDITIPDNVTHIGMYAFSYCNSLTSITIPASVTSMGESPFSSTPLLTSINVNDANPAYCDVDGVLYTKDMKTLINYPVTKASSEFIVPNGVTTIGVNAFSDCDNLTSVTIADTVTSIEEFAFEDCSKLALVDFGDSINSIGYNAFYNCKKLQNFDLPNTLKTISGSAFRDCTGITSVVMPDSVTSLGTNVFSGCANLASVTLSNNITYIPQTAFRGCNDLTSIVIPEGVTTIGQQAFDSSDSLATVTLPSTLKSIGTYAFNACGVKDVYYNGSETMWGNVSVDLSRNQPLKSATFHYAM